MFYCFLTVRRLSRPHPLRYYRPHWHPLPKHSESMFVTIYSNTDVFIVAIIIYFILYRSVVTRFLRKPIYHFISNGLKHWPLNETFRYVSQTLTHSLTHHSLTHSLTHSFIHSLIHSFIHSFICLLLKMLELWLTYIQPWRYTDPLSADNKETSVTTKWKTYISSNLPFYTTVYLSFIERSFQLDLTSNIGTMLLFRVTKVTERESVVIKWRERRLEMILF